MNQDTPAREIKTKDLGLNREAVRILLQKIPSVQSNTPLIKSVVDIRYGLGGWAQEVHRRFPKAKLIGYEQDKETFDKAWKIPQFQVYNLRFSPKPYEVYVDRVNLLLADFNTLTKLNTELLDTALRYFRPGYVIFTDVSCSKLHLNFRSYDLSKANLDLYWKSFTVPGYCLVAWEKKHYAASSAVFKREVGRGPSREQRSE